jgi:hypothetical protein
VHLPAVVQIIEARPEKPYLGLRLTFNLGEIAQLMADSRLPPPRTLQSSRGTPTGEVPLPLPAPVIQQEIIWLTARGLRSVFWGVRIAAGGIIAEIDLDSVNFR